MDVFSRVREEILSEVFRIIEENGGKLSFQRML